MRTPENRSAISYAGNLLARVSGIDEFRQFRQGDIIAWPIKLLIPATIALDRGKNNPTVGLMADSFIGMMVPLFLAGRELENLTAAIAARVVYHFAVEVVPDALRAIRRNNPMSNSTLNAF